MTQQPNNSELIINSSDSNIMMMRMENESIQALAQVRPRDHKAIVKELVDQFEAYPLFAQSAVYNKPVGKDKQGIMQYARGLSVRAAEAIAAAWGYCRVRKGMDIIDEDRVRITATFTDLQNGRVWEESTIVTKWYKPSTGGQMRKHSEDRFFNVVCKAEGSKLVRDAILRSIAAGLKLELQTMAERKMAAMLSGDKVQTIIDKFAELGVDLNMLERFTGKLISTGWRDQDRVNLLGVYNSIIDGEASVAEVFSAANLNNTPEPDQQPAAAPTDSVADSMLPNKTDKKP